MEDFTTKVFAEMSFYASILEQSCIAIGCGQLFILMMGGYLSPCLLSKRNFKISFFITLAVNILLIVAALFQIRWVLFSWAVYALLLLMGMPYGLEAVVAYYHVLYDYVITNRYIVVSIRYCFCAVVYIYLSRILRHYRKVEQAKGSS